MGYTEDVIWQVWAKAAVIGANDPTLWRKDEYGAWIFRSDYENKDSEYGWVIDYIKEALRDTDAITNLRPLHWLNSLKIVDGGSKHRVTSDGTHNSFPKMA